MLRAAIVGLGWWGKTLVECRRTARATSQFVVGHTRTKSAGG